MSTFSGIMNEFPDIRVDFFIQQPDQPAPLACFLSHVHSDHLKGLASLRSPFIYCSAATREILIRLERYWCRTWYSKGILETRQITYKNLRNLLKPLPLDTPTKIELRPGHTVQVTLLNANHCPGSVMFLFEGDGKAVLYTGDTRSEPWFVNTLARTPSIISYTSGIKTLDKIYLDTSFLDDVSFQSKAEGIAELLQKVGRYPADTIFHFQAWTYGYEDVWIALAKALDTRVHVDEYKMGIYKSLAPQAKISEHFSTVNHLCPEAAALVGYMCGNAWEPGCLTTSTDVRLHSCEKGNYCSVVKTGPVVWIQPIIAHLEGGIDQLEIGIGGGGRDLEREVELGTAEVEALLKLCSVPDHLTAAAALRTYAAHQAAEGSIRLDIDAVSLTDELESTAKVVSRALAAIEAKRQRGTATSTPCNGALPHTIRFPYSRHSSYQELCHLVDMFKPNDVWPCTEQPEEWLDQGTTIKLLFGNHCSGNEFEYDAYLHEMEGYRKARTPRSREQSAELGAVESPSVNGESQLDVALVPKGGIQSRPFDDSANVIDPANPSDANSGVLVFDLTALDSQVSEPSTTSQLSHLSGDFSLERADAYAAMIHNLKGGDWEEIAFLSTYGHHSHADADVADDVNKPAGGICGTSRKIVSKRTSNTLQDGTRQRRRM